MAARKLSRAHMMTASEVAVIIEDFRGQFRVFGEALQGLVAKVEAHDAKFEGLEAKFEGLEAKVDRGFAELRGDVSLLKLAVLDNSREIKDLRRVVDEGLAKKVDRDELEALLATRPRPR